MARALHYQLESFLEKNRNPNIIIKTVLACSKAQRLYYDLNKDSASVLAYVILNVLAGLNISMC